MTEFADIRSYIDQLEPALAGIRPAQDRKGLSKLYATRSGSSECGDYQGIIFFIAHSMGLFENQVVVIGQFVDAKGPNGSPFWVSAPSDKTAYRLPDNRKTRVKIFLNSKQLSQCSLETAVAGIARELSRVPLYMSGHALRHDEKAADLAAMMLGYRTFYVTESGQPLPGLCHLSADEISFARDLIEKKQSARPGDHANHRGEYGGRFENSEPARASLQEFPTFVRDEKSAAEYLSIPNFSDTEKSVGSRLKSPGLNEQKDRVRDSPGLPSSLAKMPDVPFS